MSLIFTSGLPNNFPHELINSAKSLEHLGILEMAWNWQNAIKVVEFFCKYGYAVLGGDVYSLINGELHSTYDSWYANKDETKLKGEFIEETRNRAISYINQYRNTNGEDFYYSVVYDKI
jgi:hypothetical protein